MGARAADRSPVPDLRIADPTRDVGQQRVAAGDDRVLVDLAVRRPGTDAQAVVGLDDLVHPIDVAQVDEQSRLGEPELHERQQAVAARQDLRLPLALGEDPQDALEAGWADVVEGCRDHRATVLLRPACGALTARAPPVPAGGEGRPGVDDRAGGQGRFEGDGDRPGVRYRGV
jgi:hypothetical protein